ncbi:MAG TPA: Fic family protein [Candidatus Limiplasma sp.]|nr:Fic family protein [Candidatus Limiplasma sp.]
MKNDRAGLYVLQPTGYRAYIPKALPPVPAVSFSNEMIRLMSDADRKLGRLDGINQILPDPDLFVAMYVQKESLLSAQIEGTQASFIDVLNQNDSGEHLDRVRDVVNYVEAMNYGLERLKELPLSLRLIREIHAILLRNGRGSERKPGEFRTQQNWVGPQGCKLTDATYVPPPIYEMNIALGELEKFLYQTDHMPSLVKIALVHAQFETIHPFSDGNGRMGRLLITFWLCQQGIMSKPLLYLSYYFKRNKLEYYDRLMNVRLKGEWEEWIKFFLKGVAEVSDEAVSSARAISELKQKYHALLTAKGQANKNAFALLDHLFSKPIISKTETKDFLDVSYPTAGEIVDAFTEMGILVNTNPSRQRNRRYAMDEYIDILNKGTEI